jgi:hypothetical protein
VTVAIVINTTDAALDLTSGRLLAPGASANVDVTLPHEASLLTDGDLRITDGDVEPAAPASVDTAVRALVAYDENPGPFVIDLTEADGTKYILDDGTLGTPASGGSGVPDGGSTGQILTPDGWIDPAAPFVGTPMPDSPDGSSVEDGSYASGSHSHPRSLLYDGHGLDDLNTVSGGSGAALAIPEPGEQQSTYVLLTAATVTIALPAAAAGKRLRIAMQQDGTGGRALIFPINVAFPGGTTPTWSTAAGAVDVVELQCFDGINWLATFTQLGLVVPPPGMSVIQRGEINSSAGFTQLTLASPVTPGNAVLLNITRVQTNDFTAPTGGGCTNWTKLAHCRNDEIGQVWLGTGSAGGAGSEVLHYGQAYAVIALEIAGVNPSVVTANDGVTATTYTTVTEHENHALPAAIAPRAGDFVGIFLTTASFSDPGTDGPAVSTAPGVYTHNGWTIIQTTNYQGDGTNLVTFAYQTNTANGTDYGDDLDIYVGSGAGVTWGAIQLFLRA